MNKFNEIFLDLEQKILDQQYPPHTLLPSENQLIQIYGVSRETIRKALNLLTINLNFLKLFLASASRPAIMKNRVSPGVKYSSRRICFRLFSG